MAKSNTVSIRPKQPLLLLPSILIATVNALTYLFLDFFTRFDLIEVSLISSVISIISGIILLFFYCKKRDVPFLSNQTILFFIGWAGCAAGEILLITFLPELPFLNITFSFGFKLIINLIYIIINIIWRECCIRFPEIANYLVAGFFTFLTSMLVFILFFNFFHWDDIPSQIISWIAGVSFGFIVNKFWVFHKESDDMKGWIEELISFISGRAVTGVIIELGLFWILTLLFSGKNNVIWIKTACTILVVIANYFWSKFLAFKDPKIVD